MLYLHSQKSVYYKSKLELAKKIWIKRLYSEWATLTPIFKLKRQMNQKVDEFRKSNLLAKALTFLRAYSNVKIDHRQKLNEFLAKKRISLQLKCLAILIDSAHETKLRALKFFDLMKPVQHKQVAFALCRWIKHHQDEMRVEMAHSFYMQRTGLSLCKKALDQIKTYQEMRAGVKQAQERARKHRQSRLARIALHKLRVYARKHHVQALIIRAMQGKRRLRVLAQAVEGWLQYNAQSKELRLKQSVMTSLYIQRLQKSVFLALLR